MTDIVSWLRELFPNQRTLAIAVALVGASILFGPAELIGLNDFVDAHRAPLLIAWGLSITYLGVDAISTISGRIVKELRERARNKCVISRLSTLTPNEAAVVREFLWCQGADELPLNDVAVSTLLQDGVLARIGMFERRLGQSLYWQLRLSDIAENNLDPKALGLDEFLPERERERRYSWRELVDILPEESQKWALARRPSYRMPKKRSPPPRPTVADNPYLRW